MVDKAGPNHWTQTQTHSTRFVVCVCARGKMLVPHDKRIRKPKHCYFPAETYPSYWIKHYRYARCLRTWHHGNGGNDGINQARTSLLQIYASQ